LLLGQSPAGPPLDFADPRRFDVTWTLGRRVVEAGQEFGSHVRAFLKGQRQRFA
jgi:hypothetical protein